MDNTEYYLKEIEYYENALLSKIKAIRVLIPISESENKTKQILKEKLQVKKFCNQYLYYLKRIWYEEDKNPSHFKKKIYEATPNTSIILDETKSDNKETFKERLARLKKERGEI